MEEHEDAKDSDTGDTTAVPETAAAALTRADLHEEFENFSERLLTEALDKFAERTAKQACERLEELFVTFSQRWETHSGQGRLVGRHSAYIQPASPASPNGTRKSLPSSAFADLEWGHRHVRSAAMMKADEKAKAGKKANLTDIWHAVRERKPRRITIEKDKEAPKDPKASPQREAENPETETETGLVEDGPTSESEGPFVDPLPLMPGRLRPLPQMDQPPEPAEMEPPPPIPMDAPPPPTAPAPLESQVKPSRHTRRPLPGLMEDETLQETSEEVSMNGQTLRDVSDGVQWSGDEQDQEDQENEDQGREVQNAVWRSQNSKGSKGKSVRKKTRMTGKMSTAWDPLVQRVNQPSTISVDSIEEDDDDSQRKSFWQIYEMIVYAWPLEYLSLTAILLNAVSIGIETDIMSRNLLTEAPAEFIIFGWGFCIFFTLEMVLKISAKPSRFFNGIGWQMNIFDLTLVALQWLDVLMTAMATDSSSTNFNVMRIVRMVRLVRIVRSYKVLRMLGEVRAIVWSVGTSFKPLLGAVLVLVGVIYLMAVYLVDTCNSYRVAMDSTDPGFQPLGNYFGSVGTGMLTLWQAMTGGVDWASVVTPLLEHTSPIAVAIFLLYIAFSLLALLNLITGVFVESAVKRGKEDKDNYLVQYVRGVFKQMEQTNARVITWEDFQASLDTNEMKELFKAIDLDISEAHCVWKILDLDDDGTLDADEFLSGCLRLRGPAKTLDVLVLMREIRSMQTQIMDQMEGQLELD